MTHQLNLDVTTTYSWKTTEIVKRNQKVLKLEFHKKHKFLHYRKKLGQRKPQGTKSEYKFVSLQLEMRCQVILLSKLYGHVN